VRFINNNEVNTFPLNNACKSGRYVVRDDVDAALGVKFVLCGLE
jgi:hypothetical protein